MDARPADAVAVCSRLRNVSKILIFEQYSNLSCSPSVAGSHRGRPCATDADGMWEYKRKFELGAPSAEAPVWLSPVHVGLDPATGTFGHMEADPSLLAPALAAVRQRSADSATGKLGDVSTAEAWDTVAMTPPPVWLLLHLWRNGIGRFRVLVCNGMELLQFAEVWKKAATETVMGEDDLKLMFKFLVSEGEFDPQQETQPMNRMIVIYELQGHARLTCAFSFGDSLSQHMEYCENIFLSKETKLPLAKCNDGIVAYYMPLSMSMCADCKLPLTGLLYHRRSVSRRQMHVDVGKRCACVRCSWCSASGARKRCSGCTFETSPIYCNTECQRLHWVKEHRECCIRLHKNVLGNTSQHMKRSFVPQKEV